MAGLEKPIRGEGRGDVKGEAPVVFARLPNPGGMKPGGAKGETPSLGEEDKGVFPRGICHEAGDGRRIIIWRIGGGEDVPAPPSRNFHKTSSIALSRDCPVRVVSFFNTSSIRSGLSSSSMVESCRTGRHRSYVASVTMLAVRS